MHSALLILVILAAEPARMKVSRVVDGDTIDLVDAAGHATRARLRSIDAPELAQPHGPESRQALSDLILGKTVDVRLGGVDCYGRALARVSVESADVGVWMVENGHAWVYRKYSRDPELLAAEARSKAAKLGLWAKPAIPPWEWRVMRRPVGKSGH